MNVKWKYFVFESKPFSFLFIEFEPNRFCRLCSFSKKGPTLTRISVIWFFLISPLLFCHSTLWRHHGDNAPLCHTSATSSGSVDRNSCTWFSSKLSTKSSRSEKQKRLTSRPARAAQQVNDNNHLLPNSNHLLFFFFRAIRKHKADQITDWWLMDDLP